MSNSFNPSLGARMKQFPKSDFGLVVYMPFLPVASEEFKSRPVVNQEDGCIYRSILVDDTWVWEKITNGVFRQYIFSTLPVVADQPVITYVEIETEGQVPQPGTRYYTKNSLNRFVDFTGTAFEDGTKYYVMSATVHSYTFDDVVDAMNSLLIEFKRWGVTFANAPASGQFDNGTYREVITLLNEMIVHVNTYSNRQLVPYDTDDEGDIPVAELSEAKMEKLVGHLNNLISAVNPYTDVLTDIQRALASAITAQTAQEANS